MGLFTAWTFKCPRKQLGIRKGEILILNFWIDPEKRTYRELGSDTVSVQFFQYFLLIDIAQRKGLSINDQIGIGIVLNVLNIYQIGSVYTKEKIAGQLVLHFANAHHGNIVFPGGHNLHMVF